MPPHATADLKARIIAELSRGCTVREVAAMLDVSRAAVGRVRVKWYREHTMERTVGSGRPKISTEAENVALVEHARQNPYSTLKSAIQETGFPGCISTASLRIRDSGLRKYTAASKEVLTERNKRNRLEFAQRYVNEPLEFWENVIFSDEKSFNSCNDGPIKIFRPRGTRFDPNYISSCKHSGRFSVNTWAWVSFRGPGPCWTIEGRLNSNAYLNILRNVMLPSVQILYPEGDYTFQQDNAPIHSSRIVQTWLRENNLRVLPWPAKSPDFNIIENVWAEVIYLIRHQQGPNFIPQNRNHLITAIEDAWDAINENYIQLLVAFVPARLQECINNQGGHTHY